MIHQNSTTQIKYVGNSEMKQYDKIIIGAGLYGLYSAFFVVKKASAYWYWNVIPRHFGALRISIRRVFIRGITIRDPSQQQ